jgi:hypothetical protein
MQAFQDAQHRHDKKKREQRRLEEKKKRKKQDTAVLCCGVHPSSRICCATQTITKTNDKLFRCNTDTAEPSVMVCFEIVM